MSKIIEFEKDDILHDPSPSVVFSTIRQLAKELAVLGKIDFASQITDLLLSQNRTQHGFSQIRFLNFAFEQTGHWPPTIPESARTENRLYELETFISDSMDDRRYDELINKAKLYPEDLALCLNIAVILCEQQGKTGVKDIIKDERVVRVLEKITECFHHCISDLIQYRRIWPLLATGVIAQQLGVQDAKLCAMAEEVVETVRIRIEEGRQKSHHEGKPIKELLGMLVDNTRKNAGPLYEEEQKEPPKSYLREPATEEEIYDLEKRLKIPPLPDDYREFLRASNGLESVYNGILLIPPLYNTHDVTYDIAPSSVKLPFELVGDSTGTAQLPRATGYDAWPSPTKQIEIGRMFEYMHLLTLPSDVKATTEAYKEALANDTVADVIKAETIRAIEDQYGSMEAFERLDWAMVENHSFEPVYCAGTFRTWLEEIVRLSARPCERIDRDSCLAYGCRL